MDQSPEAALGAARAVKRRRFLAVGGAAAAGLASLPARRTAAQAPVLRRSSRRPGARPAATSRSAVPCRRGVGRDRPSGSNTPSCDGNPDYGEALEAIEDELPIYAVDTTEDELSHAEFINAYLRSIGEQPVNLDPFRHPARRCGCGRCLASPT